MSNQVIVWSILIVPWVSLVFMKKEEIRRLMPLALFSMVITSIVIESGITLKLWNIRETTYPLNHTLSYVYGLAPVVTIWLFKFTFRRFWIYFAADTIFNLVFAFLISPWLASRGIKDLFMGRFEPIPFSYSVIRFTVSLSNVARKMPGLTAKSLHMNCSRL